MKSHRWPKIVWQWDMQTNTAAWLSDVKHTLGYVGIDPRGKLDLDSIDKKVMEQARRSWAVESTTKPKLCTVIMINEFENPGIWHIANQTRDREIQGH